ncbi:ABC transporter ATP-binding protein [Sphingomonas morindae]|uniref:ABC transporter ATP-binding protein/permease n=1 Tax=Sphingomonas morindae TaxID=1541170 RepID=A0ABY4X5R8_9SPHN|nr:ABC transporter ATP-binding protein [Sphingomonas morindae]USI72216.1 ABC transporter ATP-binding protein/permease [Sphingomonas morindae]
MPLFKTIILIASVAVSSLSVILFSRAAKELVSSGRQEYDYALYAAFLGCALLLAISSGARVWFGSAVGQHVGARLRRHLFSSIIFQPIAFFEDRQLGELVSLTSYDAALVEGAFRSSLTPLARNCSVIAFSMIMIAVHDLTLFVVLMISAPLLAYAIALLARKQAALSNQILKQNGRLAAHVGESLAAIETIKFSDREAGCIRMISARIDSIHKEALVLSRKRAETLAFTALLCCLYILFLIKVGLYEISAGHLSRKDLSTIELYLLLIAATGATIGNLWNGVSDALSALRRISSFCPHIVDAEPARNGNTAIEEFRALSVQSLSYAYGNRTSALVLKQVSFEVIGCESLAIVGASGSGKSTIVRLLLGLDRVVSGCIRINGRDISDLEPSTLRSYFSVVPQNPYIFAGTIEENVLWGRPEASRSELLAAIRDAHILDFAEALPEGIRTHVGERGSRLSGGQRQRVALARAFLMASPILILDEGTSALDPVTQSAIREAVRTVSAQRSVIMITHDLEMARVADRILVLNKGEVERVGTHDQLLATSPTYRALFADASNRVDETDRIRDA